MELLDEDYFPVADLSSDPEAEPVNVTPHTNFEVEADIFEATAETITTESEFEVLSEDFPRTKRKHEVLPQIIKRKCCERKCVQFLQQISIVSKHEIRRKFQCNKVAQKNLLLAHLWSTAEVHIEDAFEESNYYFIEQRKLCPVAYSEVTGISVYMLKVVREDFNRGRKAFYEHGNSGKGRLAVSTSNFIAWMLNFSQKYAQDSPDEKLVILPKIFIVTELYEIYKAEVKEYNISKASFYKQFKKHFGPRRKNKSLPRIRISKYSSHARCDECVKLQEARKGIKTITDLEIVRKSTEKHRQEYAGARIEINRLIHQSQSFPKDFLGMQFDDMANDKSTLPRCVEKTKGLAGLKTLKTKITGCILNSSLYQWNEKRRRLRFSLKAGPKRPLFVY